MAKREASNIKIEYKCLGASRQVTGSCHHLSIKVKEETYNLVIDCGMIQDGLKSLNELYKLNKKSLVNWETVSGVILTHAHT